MTNMRFSGHETFHCRQQWLYKGMDAYMKYDGSGFFGTDGALVELGVGKNMVRSIQFWLRSLALIDKEGNLTEVAANVFNNVHKKGDPFLEQEGTLWLLHYLLCSTEYASIYDLVFSEYFHDRAKDTFTKEQLVNFLHRKHQDLTGASNGVATKTLDNDIKVFIKSYLLPRKKGKSFEDDFTALFIDLDLIREIPSQLGSQEAVYKIHRDIRNGIPEEVFLFAVLSEIEKHEELVASGISFDDLNNTVGSIFSLSVDGLEFQIERLCAKYPNSLVYSANAGVKELQFKESLMPNRIIEEYYA